MTALAACVAAGLTKAAAGAVAFATVGAQSSGGIPLYVPHGVSIALAVCAFLAWSPRLFAGTLAATYAVAAGAFARPALLSAGCPDPPTEVLLVPLVFVAGILGLYPGLPRALSLALLWIPGAVVVEAVALSLPSASPAAAFADSIFYVVVVAGAFLAAWAGTKIKRSPSWTQHQQPHRSRLPWSSTVFRSTSRLST